MDEESMVKLATFGKYLNEYIEGEIVPQINKLAYYIRYFVGPMPFDDDIERAQRERRRNALARARMSTQVDYRHKK